MNAFSFDEAVNETSYSEDLDLHSANKMDSSASFITASSLMEFERWLPAITSIGPLRGELEKETSAADDPRNTDLNHYHDAADFKTLFTTGQFTKIGHLGDCGGSDGQIELHGWHNTQDICQLVAVKRVQGSFVKACRSNEANERTLHRCLRTRPVEDILCEVGVYCLLSDQQDLPQYILKMYQAFEFGNEVWLVLEHADGGDLFTFVQEGRKNGNVVAPKQLLQWMWQLLQAVRYLHMLSIGHRDISLENILLCNGNIRVMDFGQAVRTHSPSGEPFRYFCAVGKAYYRPPECYVPIQAQVKVLPQKGFRSSEVAFGCTDSKGEVLLYELILPKFFVPETECIAEPCGYTSPPVDVFASGVCLFMMAAGAPLFRKATLDDKHFKWLFLNGIEKYLASCRNSLPPEMQDMLELALSPDPTHRPKACECLMHPCFKALRSDPVPMHFTRMPCTSNLPWEAPLGFNLMGLPWKVH